jgi:dTDP-glucose pyrophosphorylase
LIDKVVVLAAGLGTRMRREDEGARLDAEQEAIAETGVKGLMPMRERRPFLDYVLHEVAEAGYGKVCLVIGPGHDGLREAYGEKLKARRLGIWFAVQEQAMGTANAVLAAEDFAEGDQFLMINADNLYPASACAALRRLEGAGTALFEMQATLRGSNIPAERVVKFAVGMIGGDGFLERVIEKPDEATMKAMGRKIFLSLNCWRFSPRIFEACRRIERSVRGEYEVPDAVQYSIERLGERYQVVESKEAVLDLSSRGDVAPVAARLGAKRVEL